MSKKFIILLLFLLAFYPLFTETLRNVPYLDPVYNFLERGYIGGWIDYLPQVKPYTEKQVIAFLKEINAFYLESPEDFSTIEIQQTEAYLKRFQGDKFRMFSSLEKGMTGGVIDAGAEFSLATPVNRFGDSVPELNAKLMLELTYEDKIYLGFEFFPGIAYTPWTIKPYRKYFSPHRNDSNVYTWFLSTGTEGFNHSAIHTAGEKDISMFFNLKNQITIDAEIAVIQLARERLSWGPGYMANLLLSETSKPYELLSLNMPIGTTGTFSWMTGFLKNFTTDTGFRTVQKLVSAHRVEMQFFPWLLFSLYESIIYSMRFEISYLNPFGVYFISEVTNGDWDNKLGGIDLVFKLNNVKAYLSLLADDWDLGELFNFNYFHNEMGVIAGLQMYDLVSNFCVTMEYAYMSHWMYTHRNDLPGGEGNNSNNYTHFGSHLGHFLEPNSHMIYTELSWNLNSHATVGTSFWFTQDSFGDINTPPQDVGWDIGGLYEDWVLSGTIYNFLDYGIDGIVRETNIDWTIYFEYYIPYFGVKLSMGYSLEYTINPGKMEGENQLDHIFTLEGVWAGY